MSPGDTHGLLDGRSLCLLHVLVGETRYRTFLGCLIRRLIVLLSWCQSSLGQIVKFILGMPTMGTSKGLGHPCDFVGADVCN